MRIAYITFLGLALGSSGSAFADLYVSTSGNDTQPGTKSRPFATLERARDEIRQLKDQGKLAKRGLTVWLRGGDYLRTNALALTSADSGTPQGPIVWRAYPGEKVRLLGGVRLSHLRQVSNSEVLERLSSTARAHVWQADLSAFGLTSFDAMKSRGFGRPTVPAHCELFYEGRPLTLARWPNEGEFSQIAGFPEADAQNDGHGGKIGKLEDGFFYSGIRPNGWQDTADLWVHGYWAWDWANSYEHVSALNREQHLIKTAPPHGLYGFRKGQRFYFLNILEELDSPGEWFLDRTSGQLYFWPPADSASVERQPTTRPVQNRSRSNSIDTTAPKGELLLSLLAQPLLKLTDVSHVLFRGLILEGTRADAVQIRGGTSNRIAGCVLRNLGNWGVAITEGVGHGVISCDIFDTGDGGVSLTGGDRLSLTPAGHLVENSHFSGQGRWSKCYVPAVLMNGVGLRASHNLIENHPHCAILFNGNDHLIDFNEIHHIALETGDVGAIYTGRDYTYRGNRIRFNFIHHTGGVGMGSMGIYMDDCVSGTEIFGNVFYKVQRAAFLGGGRDHQVLNNIFVDCNHAVELDGRGLDQSPVWRGMVDETMRKSLREIPLTLYRERYPAMKTLDQYYGPPAGSSITGSDFHGVPPADNVVARNVCVGKWLNLYWHATPQGMRLENNLTNAEPRFARAPSDSAKAADFALQPDSPAWKIGFQPIPVERIGLYRDELRQALLTLSKSAQ